MQPMRFMIEERWLFKLSPNQRISPESGLIKSVIMRKVVLLPEPFGPKKPQILPGITSKLISSTARKFPKFLTRCCAQMTGVFDIFKRRS